MLVFCFQGDGAPVALSKHSNMTNLLAEGAHETLWVRVTTRARFNLLGEGAPETLF